MGTPEPFSDFRLLRRKEVENLTGFSTRALYDSMRSGTFPRPLRIGKRSVAWLSQEVENWIESRVADRERLRDSHQPKNRPTPIIKFIENVPDGKRLLRLPEVKKRTGKSVASIYADIETGQFPAPISISINRVAWLESEVNDWIQRRLIERNNTFRGV